MLFGGLSIGTYSFAYRPAKESSARAVIKICLPTAVKIDGVIRITGSYCVDPEDLCFDGTVPVKCAPNNDPTPPPEDPVDPPEDPIDPPPVDPPNAPVIACKPTADNPVCRIKTPIPANPSAVNIRLSITPGVLENGKRYAVIWTTADGRHRDMIAYVMFIGPDTVRLRHGIDQGNNAKAKIDRKIKLIPGQKYHLTYRYEAGGNVSLEIKDGAGATLFSISDKANVKKIPGSAMVTDMGFDGSNSKEPASIGWIYSDYVLTVE